MIDNVMVNIGAAFMIVGGAVLVSVVLGLAIYAVALVWVSAINKLRRRAKLVTRCKDCKHFRNHPNGLCYLHTEPKTNARGYSGDAVCVEPDDYCSYGERKDGGDG